ncbi:hydrogenase expression/formation C-terminal domain-containing protein [uncultured Cohaesibacter sp.]|uniref:hydrogenase expression/formation protein n=1 Tax=uncultured Cohaesibacter sp. TaxID=1002546 RepID=UPI0029C7EB8B|nr:hydrogenase expression/formation C-terminal domain-containing protein [uncultured Cohaesibacter sp.]
MSKDLIPPAFGSLGNGAANGFGVGLGSSSSAMAGLTGPGTQPVDEDGQVLDYMEMPREMATFDPPIAPEPEDTEGMLEGKARMELILDALRAYRVGNDATEIDISDLEAQDLGLVNQLLGEGEVSLVFSDRLQAQESVLAGVWRVLHYRADGTLERDCVEIGDFPNMLRKDTFAMAREKVADLDESLPQGVFNAPSLLVELQDKQAHYKPGDPVHSINLTLLPQTEEDLGYLTAKLGKGSTIILSRGYGNCRVSSTGTRNVWWVQYYNSQDAIILNSLEVIDIPEVVAAAQEDIEDSAERLDEILSLYRPEAGELS